VGFGGVMVSFGSVTVCFGVATVCFGDGCGSRLWCSVVVAVKK
jgi:hypothetical protein